jgi:DNA-3-methyladenine glycosylase
VSVAGRPRSGRRLPRSFYERPTLQVLEELIGKVLVHDVRGRRTSGIIVEAEAYIGEADPACHAAPGPTERNAPLYGPAGHAYVYLNYGIHNLVNAVTEAKGSPAAILIRALEPLEGVELIARRRGVPMSAIEERAQRSRLCRGPGNLTVGLGITLARNRADLISGPLTIEDCSVVPGALAWSSRVGIRVGTDKPWRCQWAGHAAVSARQIAAPSGPVTASAPPSSSRPGFRTFAAPRRG